jgi:hypothetical protein
VRLDGPRPSSRPIKFGNPEKFLKLGLAYFFGHGKLVSATRAFVYDKFPCN